MNVFVSGIPLGQPRPRAYAMKMGGRYTARMYDAGTTDAWKKAIVVTTKMVASAPLNLSEAHVTLDFTMPRPKHHFRTGIHHHQLKTNAPRSHVGRPDLDNLCKAVLDALTDSGVCWNDDGCISSLVLTKNYGPDPGVLITINAPQR
jgi:Holliday junction resolvase RusA-like endonuclease